jgi:RNA polymerase sigma-70 factor (ECF subfamily)
MTMSARAVGELSEPAVPAGAEARAPARDPAAEAIFALVYKQMRAITAAKSRELDDLVQIAAERALKGLSSFEQRSRLSTWTFRICYLTFISHERSAQRWLRRFVLGEDVDAPDPLPSAAETLEQRERVERLRRALVRVSPKRRAVVVLHDLEGLDIDEVARIVGAKRNTVKSRLRDGHRQLARLLADDPYFGDAACAANGAER